MESNVNKKKGASMVVKVESNGFAKNKLSVRHKKVKLKSLMLSQK